ncbi:MAG: S1 RNA-binding domain-containing protein [Bacilli bacterium]
MSKYEKGKIVTGCVTGVEKYGIFVGLDEYYNGLIHISEISSGFVKSVNDYVNVGETIKVKVVDSNDETCQVKLSIRDIDYRMNNRKRQKIQETPSGFLPLKENLDRWVNQKLVCISHEEKEKQ